MTRRWVTLVGLVLLIAVAGVAFVDYETIRVDADAARVDAAHARASCSSSRPANILERKRRNARCDRLPGPQRVADRVERRWDRRALWYGFAAGAILLPTAVMFVLSRRRRATSPTLDSSTSGAWRVTTIAVKFAVGIMIWLGLFYLAVDRWNEFVEATGGNTGDCGRGSDCGALGELTEAHPLILVLLLLAAAAVPAAAITSSLGRFLRSFDDPPPEQNAARVTG